MLHGPFSYLLQDEDGQVATTHSVSAGLDYAWWDRSMRGCTTNIAPSMYRAMINAPWRRHARWRARKELFPRSNPRTPSPRRFGAHLRLAGKMFVVNVSGRGDKDTDIYRENLKELDSADE